MVKLVEQLEGVLMVLDSSVSETANWQWIAQHPAGAVAGIEEFICELLGDRPDVGVRVT